MVRPNQHVRSADIDGWFALRSIEPIYDGLAANWSHDIVRMKVAVTEPVTFRHFGEW